MSGVPSSQDFALTAYGRFVVPQRPAVDDQRQQDEDEENEDDPTPSEPRPATGRHSLTGEQPQRPKAEPTTTEYSSHPHPGTDRDQRGHPDDEYSNGLEATIALRDEPNMPPPALQRERRVESRRRQP